MERGLELQRNRLEQREGNEDALQKSARVFKQTDQIERALEHALKGVGSFSRTLAAGLFALNLGAAPVAAEEKMAEHPPSREETQEVEKVVGMRFEELSKDFDARILLPAGAEGKYVIHVGQSHEHPGGGLVRALTIDLAVKSQKKIESLIEAAVHTNAATCVFEEGFVDETTAPAIKEAIIKRGQEIDAALATPLTIENTKRFKNLLEISNSVVLNYVGDKLESLAKKIGDALPGLVPQNDEETDDLETINIALDLYALKKIGQMNFTYDPYMSGATIKLFMDGKIQKICPSENDSVNDRAYEAMKARDDAKAAYSKKYVEIADLIKLDPEFSAYEAQMNAQIKAAGKDGLTKEQREPIVAQLRELRTKRKQFFDSRLEAEQAEMSRTEAEFQRLSHIEREKELFRNIDDYDLRDIGSGKALGNIVVVYGNSHDFTEAAKGWNSADSIHHPIQRGLIKISPKEQK